MAGADSFAEGGGGGGGWETGGASAGVWAARGPRSAPSLGTRGAFVQTSCSFFSAEECVALLVWPVSHPTDLCVPLMGQACVCTWQGPSGDQGSAAAHAPQARPSAASTSALQRAPVLGALATWIFSSGLTLSLPLSLGF